MRQAVWDMANGSASLDWPADAATPEAACEQLGYQVECLIGDPGHSPFATIYQLPQQSASLGVNGTQHPTEMRYLIVVSMHAGFEVLGARDLKGLLLAVKALEPLFRLTDSSR